MKKSMLNLYLLLLLLIGATNVFGDHSLSFDGVNDYVDINSLVGTALTDFTYSGWYKTNGPNGDEQPIINTQNGQVTINTEQTTLYAAAYSQRNGVSPRYRVETTSNVPANEWHHFAFTAGANTYKLYIDGVLIDDSEVEEPHNSIYANSEIGAHGRSNGSNTSFFNGLLDNLSIWDSQLSQSQIVEVRNSGLSGSEVGLVAYWDFNDGTGSVLSDLSGNGHNGTVHEAVWSTDVPPTTGEVSDADIMIEQHTLSFTQYSYIESSVLEDGADYYLVVSDSFSTSSTNGIDAAYYYQINYQPVSRQSNSDKIA